MARIITDLNTEPSMEDGAEAKLAREQPLNVTPTIKNLQEGTIPACESLNNATLPSISN